MLFCFHSGPWPLAIQAKIPMGDEDAYQYSGIAHVPASIERES